jgi:hypothetical protein
MITYEANYEPVNKPYICKIFTASSGEESHTSLSFDNEAERLEMSPELIYEHLDNCVKYIQDRSKEIKIIQLDESVGSQSWPAIGWVDLVWANTEINLWWGYIYYKEERSSLDIVISDEHSHDETSDHTHDADTGEEIPNA